MALIMEDDVTAALLPYWTVSLPGLASSLPLHWGVVQLQLIAEVHVASQPSPYMWLQGVMQLQVRASTQTQPNLQSGIFGFLGQVRPSWGPLPWPPGGRVAAARECVLRPEPHGRSRRRRGSGSGFFVVVGGGGAASIRDARSVASLRHRSLPDLAPGDAAGLVREIWGDMG